MSTITHRIIDVTGGDDIWTCGDPPSKVRRYGLGKFVDNVQIRGPQGTPVEGCEFADFKEGLRVMDEMNEKDMAR